MIEAEELTNCSLVQRLFCLQEVYNALDMRLIVLFRIWDELGLCKVLDAILPLEVELSRGLV